jgi:hypothetical protein
MALITATTTSSNTAAVNSPVIAARRVSDDSLFSSPLSIAAITLGGPSNVDNIQVYQFNDGDAHGPHGEDGRFMPHNTSAPSSAAAAHRSIDTQVDQQERFRLYAEAVELGVDVNHYIRAARCETPEFDESGYLTDLQQRKQQLQKKQEQEHHCAYMALGHRVYPSEGGQYNLNCAESLEGNWLHSVAEGHDGNATLSHFPIQPETQWHHASSSYRSNEQPAYNYES